MNGTSRPNRPRPGKAVLWRYANRQPPYVTVLMQLRWGTAYDRFPSWVIRFEPGLRPTVEAAFVSKTEADRALKILRMLESRSPSILPRLNPFFWTVLVNTVRYTPTNNTYLRMAIRRCRQCV